MTGAMYASIGGLKSHMQKLSVIGNNVANVNTQGYKKQRTVFRDSVYSSYRGGSDGTQTVGGRNPSQLGYGSMVGSIDLNMSSSSYNPGNETDCAIVGDGFFLVGDKDIAGAIDPNNPDSFKSLSLTRVGDFHQDANGYFVDGTGKCVYGFMCVNVEEGNPIISDQLVPLRAPRLETAVWDLKNETWVEPGQDGTVNPPTGTEGVDWEYRSRVRRPEYQTTGDGNTASNIFLKDYETPVPEGEIPDPLPPARLQSISIDEKTGCITGMVEETGENIVVGYIAIGSVVNPNGVSHIGSSYYTAGAGAGDLSVTMMGGVASELYGVDGGKGSIQYVNGSVRDKYATGPSDGQNPDAGNDEADSLPEKSRITNTGSELMCGFLEAPNTDLAEEIAELITAQRGYQANPRIITVTDSMLEELVNMKR